MAYYGFEQKIGYFTGSKKELMELTKDIKRYNKEVEFANLGFNSNMSIYERPAPYDFFIFPTHAKRVTVNVKDPKK